MTDQAMENDRESPGHGKPRCGALARSTGKPCQLGAGAGTSHPGIGRCSRHGGSTPTHQVHAQRVAAEAAAERLGVPVDTSPTEALQGALARQRGIVLWLTGQVQALDPADLTWGVVSRTLRQGRAGQPASSREMEVRSQARIHPLFVLLQQWDARLTATATEMGRLGIEERQASLAEIYGSQVSWLMRAVLDDLRLTAEQQLRVNEVVSRRMRQLGGGAGESPADATGVEELP